MTIEKLSAVTLKVASMPTSVRFYRDLLGLEIIYGGEDDRICRSGVARPSSLSTVIGITCARHTASLDSHDATFRRHCRCLPGDLLDCCAAVGVHDPRQSDDSSRAGMLQAHGPDVRFGEHAAIALLL